MRLFNLAGRRAARLLEELADRVARACEGAVRARLGRPLELMSVDQRRGYVRARAAKVVAQEAAYAVRQHDGLSQQELTEQAMERLVARLIVVPVAVPLRRAA